jgi:hypothetical protein
VKENQLDLGTGIPDDNHRVLDGGGQGAEHLPAKQVSSKGQQFNHGIYVKNTPLLGRGGGRGGDIGRCHFGEKYIKNRGRKHKNA